jgi:hypothetical protein
MSSTFPKSINLQVEEHQYWQGLGKQEIAFHQVLGELIDNAISAAGRDGEGDPLPFTVEIILQRCGKKVSLKVADQGIGMTDDELTRHVLSPGGKGRSQGDLNEHGFGLKNSLCVLTSGNEFPFNLQTRDEDALSDKLVYLVKGPFSSKMNVELDSEANWNTDIKYATGSKGSRVYVETTFDYFNTLYKKARKDFGKLIDRLGEHLGVMYRGYLEDKYNKLWVRWQDLGSNESAPILSAVWQEKRVQPIDIPYDANGYKESTITVNTPHGKAEAIYRRGLLDSGKTKDKSHGWPYPLQIYYQGSQPTQGVDLRIGKRVLKTGQLPEIWDENRHNNFNKFVGEIILDRSFNTVNNKTAMDPNSVAWQYLLEELNDEDKGYWPTRVTNTQTEKQIKEKLKPILEVAPNSKAIIHRPVWSGSGVEIDIYHTFDPSKDVHVYEVKAGTAEPLDAYQLLMYWDGIVKDESKSPVLARLVANSFPNSVQNIIDDINARKDALGNQYKFETKAISSFGIP